MPLPGIGRTRHRYRLVPAALVGHAALVVLPIDVNKHLSQVGQIRPHFIFEIVSAGEGGGQHETRLMRTCLRDAICFVTADAHMFAW